MTTEKGALGALGKRKHGEHLSWRGDPKQTFSDWAVLLTNSDDASEQTYHLHRNVLSFEPRSCSYFRGVFDNHLQEQNDNTSRIVFDGLAARCFPLLLDYVYGEAVVFNEENVFEIKRLADYFGCEALKDEVMVFIQRDLPKNAPFYYQKAFEGNDGEVAEIARMYLISHLGDVVDSGEVNQDGNSMLDVKYKDSFNEYTVEMFRSIVLDPYLMNPSLCREKYNIKCIWNSYVAVNPQLQGSLQDDRNNQVCNFDLGSYSRTFPLTPEESLRVLSNKDEMASDCARGRKYWSRLVLDEFLQVDGSMDPGTTYLANMLDQAQVEHDKVVSENDDLKKENEKLQAKVRDMEEANGN